MVFGVSLLSSDAYFLVNLHEHLGIDSMFAIASLVGRTALYTAIGLTLEALLLRGGDGYLTQTKTRRSVLHRYWVLVMVFCVGLVVDVLLYAFAGYHLVTAGRILFSDGPMGVGQVVEAAGVSAGGILLGTLGFALCLALAIALSKWSRRKSALWGVTLGRSQLLRAMCAALGLLALLDLGASKARDPFLWERELQRVPLTFSFIPPRAELASFLVKPRSFDAQTQSASLAVVGTAQQRPDIVIVLVESLRADIVTPEAMPRLAAFANSAWTFEHALTTGNVTHYAWYGLLCSRLPIYYAAAKSSKHRPRSLALARLEQAGYQLQVLATPDLNYQQLDAIVFGDLSASGATSELAQFRPSRGNVAERDAAVVREFTQRLNANPIGNHMYLVALDSTHFEYAWADDFVPPFEPYAKTVPITHDYRRDTKARALVVNRYKNAAAWMDHLVGQILDTLAATSRLERSIIVITGDHGEAFWEHEIGSHGSSLKREQLEVGFALRLPNRPPRHSSGIFTHLDVMPTILAELGLDATGLDGEPLGERESSRSALSFQGWNERAYHLALTLPTRRLLFELDQQDPLRAKRLVLAEVTDLHDVSLKGGANATIEGDGTKVIHDLPSILGELRFLQF